MKHPIRAATLLFFALTALTASSRAKDIDREALYRHIHESFSTPLEMKFNLKDIQPSSIPGFLTGKLELGAGLTPPQTIHISEDGHYYFLSPAFKLGTATVAGLRTLEADGPQSSPPPVYLTPDNKYILYGNPLDLTISPDEENLKKMKIKGVPAWGPESAPVVLVEYSDMQCPHCKRAHEVLEKELPAAYKDKVRWIFKNYPLTMHPWSRQAALASACAVKIKPEATREIVSAFFHEQDTITVDTVRPKSLEFAEKSGINSSRFEKCLSNKESKALVEADAAEADALGVTGTPAIYINGRRARNYDFRELKAIIDEKLSAKKKN